MQTTTRWLALVAVLAGFAVISRPAAATGLSIHLTGNGYHLSYSERTHRGQDATGRHDEHHRRDADHRGGKLVHRVDPRPLRFRSRPPRAHHRHDPVCRPFYREVFRHGSWVKIGGIMCYDAHGVPYVRPGTRYVIRFY